MRRESPKLRRLRPCGRSAPTHHRKAVNIANALENLRAVLQDMLVVERHEAISEMPEDVRMVLLTFMQRELSGTPHEACKRRRGSDFQGLTTSAEKEQQRFAHTHQIRGSHYTRYQATAKFRGMCFYTREHPTEESAVEHQRILTRLLAVLSDLQVRNPEGWQDFAASACHAALSEFRTSEHDLGLRAWVQLRVDRYLGKNATISSGADSLHATFQAHKRLLRARALSWQAVRAEWHSLQLRKHVPENEAMRHISSARRRALSGRFAHALRTVKHLLCR